MYMDALVGRTGWGRLREGGGVKDALGSGIYSCLGNRIEQLRVSK